eukprot:scaffold8892_cov107-Isochrysis_galbana.AAC.1
MIVGECCVGRHASGVAAERCVWDSESVGSGASGSRTSVSSVGGSVIASYMWLLSLLLTCGCCVCLCPHRKKKLRARVEGSRWGTPDICAADRRKVTSPRTARSKNWMIFRKYPTDRLPSAYRWYSVPTKRPEAKQAHAPEIFAISAEDLREDKKSSQYLPSWDFRLFGGPIPCRKLFMVANARFD